MAPLVALLLGNRLDLPHIWPLLHRLLHPLAPEAQLSPPAARPATYPGVRKARERGAPAVGIPPGLPGVPVYLPHLHRTARHRPHLYHHGLRPGYILLCLCGVHTCCQRAVQLGPMDDDHPLQRAG